MKRKFLFLNLLTLSLLFFNVSVVSATTNTDIDFNNRMVDGRNIAYMIHPGNEYTVAIPNAVSKLMYPSGLANNLVLNRTNSHPTSKMDFYQYYAIDRINAYTSTFRKNTSGQYYNSTNQMDSYDWVYGEIRINDYYMNNHSSSVREAVVLHEMLHVYGLKDISNTNSIMYYATPSVSGVTSDANNVLNRKY